MDHVVCHQWRHDAPAVCFMTAYCNDMLAVAAYSAPPSPFDSHAHLLHGVVHANGFGHLARVNGREGGSQQLSGMDRHSSTTTALSAYKFTVMSSHTLRFSRSCVLSNRSELSVCTLSKLSRWHLWCPHAASPPQSFHTSDSGASAVLMTLCLFNMTVAAPRPHGAMCMQVSS